MAEFYADISAVGNEYQAYAATPSWGALSTDRPLPMDGTGLAGPGSTPVVAIAEMQITVLPADGNTLSIAGGVLTAKTTAAAKNQWTIGASITTCVTNLVSLINTYGTGTAQCDAAVSANVCSLVLALPYWQFARVKPGTTDTLQIATRIAGSDLNYSVNPNVAIASSGWGTPPTITQFVGGADGPFAYLLNITTVFGKSDNQGITVTPAYGLFFNASPGPSDPTASDVIHVRSRRSGSNLTISYFNSANSTVFGTWKSRAYLFDNGTVWSGGSGTLQWTIRQGLQGFQYSITSPAVILESRSQYNFEIIFYSTNNIGQLGTLANVTALNQSFGFIRCKLTESPSNFGTFWCRIMSCTANYTNLKLDISDSYIQVRGSVRNNFIFNASTGGGYSHISAYNTIYEVVGATGALTSLISASGGTSLYEWVGGAVRDSNGVYKSGNPFGAMGLTDTAIIDSVDGVYDPSYSFSGTTTGMTPGSLRWIDFEGSPRAYRLQTGRFSLDWKNDGTFPYYGAAADLHGVNWSHRLVWNDASAIAGAVDALRLSCFYRSSNAVKTIALSLYVPDSTPIYTSELDLMVTYIDSMGARRTERAAVASLLSQVSSRTALSSHSGWTPNGVSGYSAKKLQLTTTYAVKQNTDITASLVLKCTRNPSITFYVSPELVIS